MNQSRPSKRINKSVTIQISIAILIILLLIAKNIYDSHMLKSDYRYTIGSVFEIKVTRSGYCPHFIYNVNGEQYEGSIALNKLDNSYIGERYIVKFYTKNPNNCSILLAMPVSDSIQKIPDFGWSKDQFRKLFGKEIE
jgi:hypothetical protein